uniref:Epsin 2 n=1 Tax=Eptatretus burgeri TaxID=7764 RepID=A0A8C4QX79_EPTBU
MATSSLRRQMKNIVNNFSEAEVKVREATSNDPWGPSSSLMSEIADLTYNNVAFSEIMSMIWKRLNDHGKNWRHVYKALTLLDYLIKTGSDRVAQQCKENIYAIQTLKDFQYVDRDSKDQGVNVREKSKQLVALLRDEERLRSEREHAMKTKERLAQGATGLGSNNRVTFGRGSSQPNLSTSYSDEYGKAGGSPASYHGSTSRISSDLEQARPQTSGEEELQLQLALAMSREEAEQSLPSSSQEEPKVEKKPSFNVSKRQPPKAKREDDLQLQLALSLSKEEHAKSSLLEIAEAFRPVGGGPATVSADPWGVPIVQPDPWGGSSAVPEPDPWQGSSPPAASFDKHLDPWDPSLSAKAVDPWETSPITNMQVPKVADPWTESSPSLQARGNAVDPWAPAASTTVSDPIKATTDPWAPAPKAGGKVDPFSAVNGSTDDDLSAFDTLRSSAPKYSTGVVDLLGYENGGNKSPDAFELSCMTDSLPRMCKPPEARKTPESFLGPNAALVNLDSLISRPSQPVPPTKNPFLATTTTQAAPSPSPTNPFHLGQAPSLTLNQLRSSPGLTTMQPIAASAGTAPSFAQTTAPEVSLLEVTVPGTIGAGLGPSTTAQPLIPGTAQAQPTNNPFLL